MPMARHKLGEVGLGDWPDWFRRANPDCFASDLPSRAREPQRRSGSDDRGRRYERDIALFGVERNAPSTDNDGNTALKGLKSSVFESRERERRRKLLTSDSRAPRGSPVRASREMARCVDDRAAKAETKSWEEDVDSDNSTSSSKKPLRGKTGKGRLLTEAEGGLIDV
jgi:hypothetical protein